jgi:hypothetical protein
MIMAFRSFDIPAHSYQSTDGARHAFRQFWDAELNCSDDDIRAVAKTVPTSNQLLMNSPFGATKRTEHMLWVMREQLPQTAH